MTYPPQDPRRPLLQTVCHAGLLTLAALMADQAHQLPRLGLDTFPNDQQSLYARQLDEITESATESQDPEVEAQKDTSRTPLQPEEGKELPDGGYELPSLELPSAPIYSFDEDGDILQCMERATFRDKEEHFTAVATFRRLNDTFGRSDEAEECPVTPYVTPDMECTQTTLTEAWKDAPTEENNEIQTQETGEEVTDAATSSHPILASVGAAEETVPHIDFTLKDTYEPAPVIVPGVTVVSNPLTVTPKIKLHASSVEVEDDYLEGPLEEDHHLRDFCATFLGECDWQSPKPQSTQTHVVGLLSVSPHDNASRKTPRVPFNAVVFTERKPSTGNALVLSLGLSADGANTIQDIASRNQGAARERLQQGEVVPCEARMTKHCESCGVSPEECLKKLGLHSDNIRPVASPKSERLLHFFKHIPADIHTRVKQGTAPLSAHEFEQGLASPKQKSRSLSSSPTNIEDDGRKSRMAAF